MQRRSQLELLMEDLMRSCDDLPEMPEREFKFWKGRKFAFDFAFKDIMLAIEVEGGRWGGRHTTASGFDADCRKYGEAICRGWTVIRVTDAMIYDGTAINFIVRSYNRLHKELQDGSAIRERTAKEISQLQSGVAVERNRQVLEKATVEGKKASVEGRTCKTRQTTTRVVGNRKRG